MKENNETKTALQIEIDKLQKENDNYNIVVNASMATSGYIKHKAIKLGYDSRKELSELEYIVSLAERNTAA